MFGDTTLNVPNTTWASIVVVAHPPEFTIKRAILFPTIGWVVRAIVPDAGRLIAWDADVVVPLLIKMDCQAVGV